jgi:hypothetical protein
MKFTVYYGRDFYEQGRETGKQMVKKLLSETSKNDNKDDLVIVPENKGVVHDRV